MQPLLGNLEIERNEAELLIWEKLEAITKNEDGILGYKIPSIGMDREFIPSFIIRSSKYGIVLVDVVNAKLREIDESTEFWIADNGDEIYSRDIRLSQFHEQAVKQISKDTNLYNLRSRSLKIAEIRSYLVFPYNTRDELNALWSNLDPDLALINESISGEEIDISLEREILKDGFFISQEKVDIVNSLFENTSRITPKRRVETNPETISDYIDNSLNFTFVLDETQRKIAMQVPDGPQRVRGLAGTGKTVILSMKAALVHKDFPHYKILFVFNTQSMYNQIQQYITDYHIREKHQNPNWDNLEILHAWGGRTTRDGLYYKTALKYNIDPKTFMDVRRNPDPLDTVYTELLDQVRHKLQPEYDVVLIDEAQDFSPALFETVYYLTKEPKRIIWAYDEFQSLKELKIKESDDLFGKDINGNPNLSESVLAGQYKGGIDKDFVLPNSYRNPRVSLMVAHGIGMGLYNPGEIIPIKDRSAWHARGYKIHSPSDKPTFETGDQVIVERLEKNSRNILEKLLKEQNRSEQELVNLEISETIQEELDKVTEQIDAFVHSQGVAPEEIVVINLKTSNAKKEFEYLRRELDKKDVKAITPGFIEKVDKFKEKDFVTLSTTFRAKGNEANVVFILNAQSVINNPTYKGRNGFFVAVTRSRGWCFIYSNGQGSEELKKEFESILSDYPRFNFEFPDMDEVQRRLELLSAGDSEKVEKADASIDKILSDDLLKKLLYEKILRNKKAGSELRELLDKNDD